MSNALSLADRLRAIADPTPAAIDLPHVASKVRRAAGLALGGLLFMAVVWGGICLIFVLAGGPGQ